jgi:hypothetical protein
MKFDIPDDWCRAMAQAEAEDSTGGATAPINPELMAAYAAKADAKRAAELKDSEA